MREKRQIQLSERQIMLTRIARREAMTALAGSLGKEAQSAALAERSRALLRAYNSRQNITDGQTLHELKHITCELARLARDADAAHVQAQHEGELHAGALAGADAKIKRLEEHRLRARNALSNIEAAREGYGGEQVAQKLLRALTSQTGT